MHFLLSQHNVAQTSNLCRLVNVVLVIRLWSRRLFFYEPLPVPSQAKHYRVSISGSHHSQHWSYNLKNFRWNKAHQYHLLSMRLTAQLPRVWTGKGEPADESGVLRAAQQAADQTTSGHRTAGGDQVWHTVCLMSRCYVTHVLCVMCCFLFAPKGPSVSIARL